MVTAAQREDVGLTMQTIDELKYNAIAGAVLIVAILAASAIISLVLNWVI